MNNINNEAVRKILIHLYKYQLMTPFQLAVSLNYKKEYIYNQLSKAKELVRKIKVPFIWPNASAYFLDKKMASSVSRFLKEEALPQHWPEYPSNVIQILTANQFNCELILGTKNDKNSGIISWLGQEDTMEKYAEIDEQQNKKVYNIKPEAYAVLQLPNKLGRIVYHLDVLTGEENDMIYEDKLTKYLRHIREYWLEDTSKVSLLFLCHNSGIIPDLLEIWETIVDKNIGDTPQVGFASYQDIIEQGVWANVWHVLDEQGLVALDAFAKFKHQDYTGEFIGKQVNLKFAQRNFLLRRAKASKLEKKPEQKNEINKEKEENKNDVFSFYVEEGDEKY